MSNNDEINIDGESYDIFAENYNSVGGTNIEIRPMGNEPVIANAFDANMMQDKEPSPETQEDGPLDEPEDNYSDSAFEDDFETEEEEAKDNTKTSSDNQNVQATTETAVESPKIQQKKAVQKRNPDAHKHA